MGSSSLFESIQKRSFFPTMPLKDDLPISQPHHKADDAHHLIGLRRRLSSFSVKIQPLSSAFPRSKSMPAIGELAGGPLRRWWRWGWGWVLSRKPVVFFGTRDVEMNEEEAAMLGCHGRGGTWRHVFYKLRAEVRKLMRSDSLPTTQAFRYDSYSYAQNFDDGAKRMTVDQ